MPELESTTRPTLYRACEIGLPQTIGLRFRPDVAIPNISLKQCSGVADQAAKSTLADLDRDSFHAKEERSAERCIRAGPGDYVIKGRLSSGLVVGSRKVPAGRMRFRDQMTARGAKNWSADAKPAAPVRSVLFSDCQLETVGFLGKSLPLAVSLSA